MSIFSVVAIDVEVAGDARVFMGGSNRKNNRLADFGAKRGHGFSY
jgi:hypothetical protein